jgi:uncharacterized membrane protein
LLSVGIFIELFSFLWRRSSARLAGRWMILLGAITAVPALTSGLYAYRDSLSPMTNVEDVVFQDKWTDLLDGKLIDRASAQPGKETKEITVEDFLNKSDAGKALWKHLLYNSIGVGVLFLAIIGFIGSSDRWRKNLYLPLLVILLAGEGLLVWGSHAGGIAVYEHAVAVKPPTPVSTIQPTVEEKIKAVVPPAQLHITLAGWVVAMALIALAVSIRALTEGAPAPADESWYEGQEGAGMPPVPPPSPSPSEGILGTSIGEASPHSAVETVPVTEQVTETRPEVTGTVTTSETTAVQPIVPIATSRFWLLATLFTLATTVSGLWIINAWNWDYLVRTLKGENRNMYHSILGVSVIVMTLVLALITRIARKSKVMISIASLLLFLLLGLQVYVGILLTFDGPKNAPKGTKPGLLAPFQINAASKD